MPDLRWSWCNNNKVYNKCNALESSWNHTPPRQFTEKLSSMKPIPDAKKIGDCCSSEEHILAPGLNNFSQRSSKNRFQGLPWCLSGKESAYQCRRLGFDPWSREITLAVGQLSPCATTTEAQVPRARVPHPEKPLQWEDRKPQLESGSHSQLEQAHAQRQKPSATKNISKRIFLKR